ncbi:ankyrin repeat-containing protein [Tanacetum coccineum]
MATTFITDATINTITMHYHLHHQPPSSPSSSDPPHPRDHLHKPLPSRHNHHHLHGANIVTTIPNSRHHLHHLHTTDVILITTINLTTTSSPSLPHHRRLTPPVDITIPPPLPSPSTPSSSSPHPQWGRLDMRLTTQIGAFGSLFYSDKGAFGLTAAPLGQNSFVCCVEHDHVGMVRTEDAAIKANNRFDVFHIAAKQGHLEVLKILMKAQSELSMATKSLVIRSVVAANNGTPTNSRRVFEHHNGTGYGKFKISKCLIFIESHLRYKQLRETNTYPGSTSTHLANKKHEYMDRWMRVERMIVCFLIHRILQKAILYWTLKILLCTIGHDIRKIIHTSAFLDSRDVLQRKFGSTTNYDGHTDNARRGWPGYSMGHYFTDDIFGSEYSGHKGPVILDFENPVVLDNYVSPLLSEKETFENVVSFKAKGAAYSCNDTSEYLFVGLW